MAQPQMIDEIGSITQRIVTTFREYLEGEYHIIRSNHSNGRAIKFRAGLEYETYLSTQKNNKKFQDI